MKGPHICDCLCALCERLGAGAFGPQPDGSAGVVVIGRRRPRRRPPNRAQAASLRQLGRAVAHLAKLLPGRLPPYDGTPREAVKWAVVHLPRVAQPVEGEA